MATTVDTITGIKDGNGNIVSIRFNGTTTDCNSNLRIQVSDPNSGDELFLGPVAINGTSWTKTFQSPEDFVVGDISCDQLISVSLSCRDSSPSVNVFAPANFTIDCTTVPCQLTIDSVSGNPAASGLRTLTVTGTASGCTTGVSVEVTDRGVSVFQANVNVVNGQWQAVFTQGDNENTNLKSFHCGDTVRILVQCGEGKTCVAQQQRAIVCPGNDCQVPVTLTVNGAVVNNNRVQCANAGNYTVAVSSPASASIRSISWTRDGVAVQNQASDPSVQTVSIGYSAGSNGGNVTVSVVVVTTDGCIGNSVITFSCDVPTPGNNPPPTGGGKQPGNNTGQPPQSNGNNTPSVIVLDLCLIWMFLNIGLFIITAVLIFIFMCMIQADTWSAVAALASGGALSEVTATLTAAEVGLLIAAAIFAVVSLASFILWVILCLAIGLKNMACQVLSFLMLILSLLTAGAAVLSIILWFAGQTFCAVGAFIDIGWFGTLSSILFLLNVFFFHCPLNNPFALFNSFGRSR